MIILSACELCFSRFQILVDPEDVELIKQISDGTHCSCPRLCGGRINLVGGDPLDGMNGILKDRLSLTAKELYRAINGAGLPDEIQKDPIIVRSLIMSNKVTAVDVEDLDGKIYLHRIDLDGGTQIHLGTGLRGAQVVKVTKCR